MQVIDNGSTDETSAGWWSPSGCSPVVYLGVNCGVSFGWNFGLSGLFDSPHCGHVLVINNDVVLPPWFYRQLLEYDKPFISGVSVDKMEQIEKPAPFDSIHPHPDFSAFLIKREVWEKVGPFDERMKHYASDNDFHVRAHKAGIPLWKANVPFYHERSSTLNRATPEERQEIETQANKDREVFKSKWGVLPWGEGYDALFL
jgi:GT2 family glycosyltransferase